MILLTMRISQVYWPGADGLQGPVISGTNFYINRKALYGFSIYNGVFRLISIILIFGYSGLRKHAILFLTDSTRLIAANLFL